MAIYTRESTITFSHTFVDLHGDPIPPADVTYPQVQIDNPSGAIVASGIAVTSAPGAWQWSWTIPAGATLGDGWKIRWTLVDPSLSTHSYDEAFTLADQVKSPTGLDRLGAYLCVRNQSERVVWKDDSDPEYLDLTLRDLTGNVLGTWNKSILVPPVTPLSYVYDQGLHVYYADTPTMADWGDYLALWRSRPNVASAYVTETQMVHVPHDRFFFMVPYLRQLLDKLGKVTTTPLSYLDLELYQSFVQGLAFVNGVVPFTDWGWTNYPQAFQPWWVMAAGIFALNARQLLEIELQHCLVGGTLVRTEQGLHTVHNLVESNSVCRHCGTFTHPTAPGIYETDLQVMDPWNETIRATHTVITREQPTICAETRFGYSLRGTTKQKVRVLQPDCTMVWRELQDLQVGEYVALSAVPDTHDYDLDLTKIVDRILTKHRFGSRADFPEKFPSKMTPELARVLGYLVSEGTVTMDVTTRFTNTDYDLIKDYVHCAKAAFGAFIPIHVRERPEKTKSGATAWDVDIHSVVIRTFLAELGLPYSRAADKTVPWSILQASTHNAKYFIRAYLDGHILRKSSTPGFSSSSLRLLRQLQVLLLRFGVVSCLNKPRRIDDNFWRCGKLHVHSIYADIYAKVVGFGFKKFQAPRRRIEFGGIPYVQEYVVFKSTGLRSKHYHLSLREYLKRRSAGTRSPYRHQIRHDQLQGFLDDSDWLDLDPSVYHTLKEISDTGFIWQRVTDISRAKSTVTYDVTLPACGRLPHAFQANGFVVHNSAQSLSVTLDYDHHSPLSEVIGRWETMIREWLPNAKLGAYRIAAGPGSVGVRPMRLSWTSRVFKIGSSNNPMGDLVNLMSALGLP